MARQLYNQSPVAIYCDLTSTGIDLVLDSESLDNPDDENAVLVETKGDPLPSITFNIHAAQPSVHDVYAWEVTASGHDLFDLHSQGHRHRSYVTIATDILIVLVPTGDPPPAAPPAPGTSSTVLKVTVTEEGSTPI